MSLKQLFNRITIATIVAGTTCAVTTPVLAQVFAQGFYFPSASFFSPFAAPYESEDEEPQTLAMLLQGYPDFNSRLEEANLLEFLEKQEYLTVLVPSEEAFAALSPEMQETLADSDNMQKLLEYHVVVGKIGEQDIKRQSVATVLEKNSVQITGVPVGDKIGVKLNEATASKPFAASDGVVIPIDQVLIPPEFSAE